jgi:L-ribulose-5-phosphate 4-epimerase
VIIDLEGRVVEGRLEPSSEAPMHLAIYGRFSDARAVVHTHSVHAIALGAVGMEIPVVCLEVVPLGGTVPVAPYVCPGSPQVGEVACEALGAHPGLKALLLRNHGLVAMGEDLEQAFRNAYNCETAAEIYHLALQTGRTPVPLSGEQINGIHRRYQKA